jgi:pyridoxamine 5'-phosphate oxidase
MIDPVAEFLSWYEEAVAAGCEQPEAMALATAEPNGTPSVRIVLFRGISNGGIRFFTNFESRKGRELERNPACASVFYWAKLGKQVRFEGTAERLSDAEADAYFASRPTGHKLAAWASPQSRPLASRDELIECWHGLERTYGTTPIPRPPFWGGYRLLPHSIELWTVGQDRLHTRARFQRCDARWEEVELGP